MLKHQSPQNHRNPPLPPIPPLDHPRNRYGVTFPAGSDSFMPHADLSWRTSSPVEGFYTSEVQAVDRRPIRTFLPTGYEPHYAYPLLVFFHGHGGDEEQVLRLAP